MPTDVRPEDSTAFAQGVQAYNAMISIESNPYDYPSDEYIEWNDGWWYAQAEGKEQDGES